MGSRYLDTPYFRNTNPLYSRVFENRGVPFINQYGTSVFTPLTPAQKRDLNVDQIVWKASDRLEKLSAQHYNDPTYWWVIARYNQKPTDFNYIPGQTVYIPKPLTTILSYYMG